MTATYTFDVFSSLDGYGAASPNWTGYWGKQGPELLDHRLALYEPDQRMVFGANTYRAFARMLASSTEESDVRDPWVTRMISLPATVVSTTLEGPLDSPDATLVSGDAVDVVARLKEESEVPLRSHGSLSLNRALMAAGLVDRVQVTLFPVITGQTGLDPIFQGAEDSTWSWSTIGRSTDTSKSSPTDLPPLTDRREQLAASRSASLLPDYSRQAERYDETRGASPSVLRPLREGLDGRLGAGSLTSAAARATTP